MGRTHIEHTSLQGLSEGGAEFEEESRLEVMMWAWSCLVFVRERVAA